MASKVAAIVVGLGGVTNGGKTTMCNKLKNTFSSNKYNIKVLSMHLDHYFRLPEDPYHMHLEEYNHHDWECLNALHVDQFMGDINLNRLKCDILIVEGFLIFNIPNKEQIFDLAYFFDLTYEDCLQRRQNRNYNPPDPPGYFEGHVWNAYLKAKKEVLEHHNNQNIIIFNATVDSFENIENQIIKDIEKLLAKPSN